MDIRKDAIKSIDAMKAIKDGISRLTDDADAIRDTLDGQTDVAGMVASLVASIDEDTLLLDGIDSRMEALKIRRERLEHRVEAKRALIQQGMEIADQKAVELPSATLTLKKVPPKLVVVNEAAVPPEFFATKVTLDKKKVLDALKDGKPVDGCQLSNGSLTLQIRRG